MTVVVDASVLVAALVDTGAAGQWAEDVVAGHPLVAPDHVLVETASVLRRAALTGALSDDIAGLAHRDLLRRAVELVPYEKLSERVWELRHNVPPYDAAYVAVAEALHVPLATLDARLSRASGVRCRFLTPPGPPSTT